MAMMVDTRDRTLRRRLASLPWPELEASLSNRGYAATDGVLTATECESIVAMYPDDERFRSRVDMARHRFGIGEYKYFAAPLPPLVQELRVGLYPRLAAIANRWMSDLGARERYPETLEAFLARCHRRGQMRPTPLVLRYEAGGYNCLHQDLYGEVAFPLQAVIFLCRPGVDYTGGEFVLVEQRPRAQSAAEVVHAGQGGLVIFTTRTRPARGVKGHYRVNMRHGVSRLHSGTRYALGIIFHDAR
jgi:hypothetical protein